MKKKISQVIIGIMAIVTVFMVFAACQPSKYTITFETNGGNSISSISAEAGVDISDRLPADPKKDGFDFAGWFDNKECSGEAVTLPKEMPNKNVTYYAKWSEAGMATLKLDALDATLEKDSFIIPAGDKISDYIKDIKPTVEGLTFLGWRYDDGKELDPNDVMPGEGLTLTAKYSAKVVLSVYKKGLDGNYGAPVTKEFVEIYKDVINISERISEEHFHIAEGQAETFTVEKGDNKFDVYLERDSYTVKFNADFPSDCTQSDGEVKDIVALYEQEIVLPDNAYNAAFYRFAAWKTENGTVYEPGASYKVDGNAEFFASWDKGYFDRFGGIDVLYVLSGKDEGKVILSRPVVGDIEGTIKDDRFTVTKGDDTITGKISDDGRFVYYREAQEGTYRSYEPYNEVVSDVEKIELDGYDSAKFTDTEGTVHSGVYSADYDEETGEFSGMYKFVTADNYGFYFMMQEIEGENGSETVFLIQSQYNGVYYRFVVNGVEGNGLVYQTFLILDGFGSAMIAGYDEHGDFDVSAYGQYKVNEGTGIIEAKLSLDTQNYDLYHYKLVSLYNVNVYIECNEDLVKTFVNGNDKLTLDGYGDSENSAVYVSEGVEQRGTYFYEEYPGSKNKIIRFAADTEVITFRLDGDKFTVVGGGAYGEYYRYTSDYKATQPYIILDGNGKMSLYSADNTGNLVEIASGSYVVDEEVYEAKLTLTDPDFAEFKSYLNMKFTLKSEVFTGGSEQRTLWLYTIVGTNKTYNGEDDSTLVLDEYGYGVYYDGSISYDGKYFISEREDIGNILEFAVFDDDGDITEDFFFMLNEQDKSFTLLSDEIGAYTISYSGSIVNADEVLFLSGNGKAILYSIDEEGNLSIKCNGSYTMTSETLGSFDSDKIDFDFMLSYLGENAVYTKFDSMRSGEFVNGNDKLVLDGYEFSATFAKEGSNAIDGYYYINDSLVVFIISDSEGNVSEIKYFELGDNKTFVERSYEWGEYVGWSLSGGLTYEILKLDGHNNAELYLVSADGTNETLAAKGKYELKDEYLGEYEFNLKNESDNQENNFKAILATYGGEPVFIKYDGNSATYKGGLCALDMDGYGNAAYLDKYGILYSGTYSMLGKTIVKFDNDDMGETFFKLDAENKSFAPITDGFVYEGNKLYKYLGNEKNITIPNGITEIGEMAFSAFASGYYTGKDIISVNLNGVTKIGDNAFRCCYDLTRVKGNSVKDLGYGAFESCIELASIDLPNLEIIGQMAFYGCDSITTIRFSKVTRICAGAFSYMGALEEAVFPIVEVVESAAFYDCPALKLLNLGSQIKEIQDEAFEAASTDCERLVVILNTRKVVKIGVNEFTFRDDFIIKVPNIKTVFKYYEDESWRDYANHVGCRSEDDGTFYNTYLSRVSLNGVFYMYGSIYGAYEITDGENGVKNVKVYNYYNGTYSLEYTGTISESGLSLTDNYDYTMEYPLAGGQKLELTERDTETKLTFTMGKEAAWTVDATYGNEKVQVQLIGSYLYIVEGQYRKTLDVDFENNTFYVSYTEFIPVVELYNSSTDKSWIYISQNNAEKTSYAVTQAAFEGIKDEDGNYLYITDRLNINVQDDGGNKKFTFSKLFGSANYTITVVFNERSKTFTYSVKALTKVELKDGDNSLVVWIDESREITDIEFYYGGTKATKVEYVENNGVYLFTVLDRGYEALYNVKINKLFTECSITKNGKNGSYFIDSVARVAVFLTGSTPQFRFFAYENYEEVEVKDITYEFKNGCYEITANGQLYYVSYTESGDTLAVTLVKAEYVYTSSYNGEVMTLKFDKDGELISATLKVGEKTLNGTRYIDQWGVTYYRFIDGDTLYSVEPYNSGMNCYITEYAIKTVTNDNITITYITEYGSFKGVISVKFGDVEKEFDYSEIYEVGVLIEVEGEYYLFDAENESVAKANTMEATTSDGQYKFTVLVGDNKVISVVRLEIKEGDSFVERKVNDSYYNSSDEMIVQAEGLDSPLHCTFEVSDGKVTAKVIPQ